MKKSRDDYLTIFFISIIGIYILIALAFPMYAILSKSVENKEMPPVLVANDECEDLVLILTT